MAFKTFVALDTLPASDMNTYLMKQAVIVCTTGTRPGSPVEGMLIYETDTDVFCVYNGAAWVQITPEAATVLTSEGTTSTSFTDLATGGPAVTIQTNTKALVELSAGLSTSSGSCLMSYAVSGATTIAASDDDGVQAPTVFVVSSAEVYDTGLTAGSNTFTSKYRTSAGTGTFLRRRIRAVGLP